MVMLAEQYEYVIGGDPDRDTIDLAVVDTATGVVRGHHTDGADGFGYGRLLSWVREPAPGRRVSALEGTGSVAAGLATMLAEAGEDVVEISGGKRTRGAKSDRIDAVRAARTALAREHQATPRARGLWEALRQILVTRQGILVSRTKAINELKSLIVVAPEHLRAGLRGVALHKQLNRITALSSPSGATVEHRVTVPTLYTVSVLDTSISELRGWFAIPVTTKVLAAYHAATHTRGPPTNVPRADRDPLGPGGDSR